MRVMTLFSTSFFAKYLREGKEGPGRGHLCHTDTFLVFYYDVSLIRGPNTYLLFGDEAQSIKKS